MSAHVKHVVWAVVACVGLLVIYIGIERWKDIRAKEIDAQTQVAVALNKQKDAQAAQQVQEGQKTIVVADNDLRQRLVALEAERAQHPTSAQTQTQIQGMLPGVVVTSSKDNQGNPILSVPDTQLVRDTINGVSTDYKSCQFSLTDCKTAREQYEKVVVPGLNAQLQARQDTINQQERDLAGLRKRQVSPFMVGFGVGKIQGNFNNVNSYQPDVLFGYRFDTRFGLFVNAQNKSVAAGVTWNIGGKR